ncbi:MAG: amidohydrolase family protein [Candidatus Aminicenantes bacterium]|nr:amidohydrolase family protein [Candidatus Aminicenantes bacterium]
MKIKKNRLLICLFTVTLLLAATSSARVTPTYAIVNCKIISVTGSPIEKGTIIIRDGLIESLGPQGKISIPEDAEIIKAEGQFAYPGLIDAHTNSFLELPKEEPRRPGAASTAAVDPQQKEKAQHPDLMALKLLKPKKTAVADLHKIGITTVLVAPERGIYAGQSVLLNVNGENAEPMVIKSPVALHVNFTTARGTYPSSLMGTMAFLRQSFLDTGHYSSHKSLFTKSPRGLKRPEHNPFLEALSPYAVKKSPIFFNCANLEDIKRALGLIKEFKLNGFLTGANEAWRVADLLTKHAKVPLLVSLNFKPPMTSIYVNQGEELKKKAEEEIYPANAANLYKKRLTFAFTSQGLKKSSDIPKNVQKAIKAGLPKEEALKAMTIIPAKFLGVSSFLGSLEPGKIANIILTSGEIFDEKTKVKRVFVDGISFEIKEPPKGEQPAKVNIAGKWSVTVSSPMGEMESTMELEQEGNEISGSISSSMGKWEIRDGILSGNELALSITATIMGETMDMSFSGTAERDSIEGTITIMEWSAELKATRIPDREY